MGLGTLVKAVVGDDGRTAVPGDFTLTADGPTAITGASGADPVTGAVVDPGDHALEESGPDGCTGLGWVCVDEGPPSGTPAPGLTGRTLAEPPVPGRPVGPRAGAGTAVAVCHTPLAGGRGDRPGPGTLGCGPGGEDDDVAVTTAPARVRPPFPRWLNHLLVTVVVMSAGALPSRPGEVAQWSVAVGVLNAVLVLVLLARFRAPRQVLVLVVVALWIGAALGGYNTGAVAAAAVAVYHVVLVVPRRVGVRVTFTVAALVLVVAIVAGRGEPMPVLAIILGGAVGEAVRTQREQIAAALERAERAERTREAVVRQRLAEERLSIARDLHDVVAHQIAVINLHAGVASAALRTRPAAAEESLGVIRGASRTVLTDIGQLLATLRDPDAVESGPIGLARLDEVVRGFEAAGLAVTVRTTGTPVDLPPATDVAALRILQEALTNAHKHGGQHRAHVLLDHRPGALEITVTNPVVPIGPAPPSAPVGTGNGLTGMTERAESVRGTLHHEPDDAGWWKIVARLPVGDPSAGPSPGVAPGSPAGRPSTGRPSTGHPEEDPS